MTATVLAILMLIDWPFTSTHQLDFDIRSPVVIGDHILVLVEASTLPWKMPDSAAQSNNIRGYLLNVLLTKDANKKPQVIGPLWSLEGPISSMTNNDGLTFTDKDRSDLQQKPVVFIESDGQVVRLQHVEKQSEVKQSVLEIKDNKAKWVDHGTRKNPKLLSPFSSEFQTSQSGQFVVQREQDNIVRVYDIVKGEQRSDKWLEAAFGDVLSREDLGNSRRYLTDDLKYLVVFPDPTVEVKKDKVKLRLESFSIDGESYSRKDHGVVYTRDSNKPKVFAGLRYTDGAPKTYSIKGLSMPPMASFRTGVPLEPYSIHGQLLFLQISDDELALKDLDAKSIFSQKIDPACTWLNDLSIGSQFDLRACL